MLNTYLKWINYSMNGGPYKFRKFYKLLVDTKPAAKDLGIYFTLRTILEIRLGLLGMAQISNMNAIKSSKNSSAIGEFLSGIIEQAKGNKIDAQKYFDHCLALEPSFYPALKSKYLLLSQNRPKQESENLFRNAIKERPNDTRLLIEYFLFSQRENTNLKKAKSLLIKKSLNKKENAPSFPLSTDSSESLNFKDSEAQYFYFCGDALKFIENIFAIKIEKNFQAWQSTCRLEDTLPVTGEALTRAKPVLKDGPDTKNKGLQMLCSPGYWTTSQNHLLCFILSEIQIMRSERKINKPIKFHEIGPGCGYLMLVLSKLKGAIVSGSDCYDKRSFDLKALAKQKPTFSETIDSKLLEHFCYYVVNNISGMLGKITLFPVTKKSFPKELLEANIVYSHLPVIDLYDEKWGAGDWNLFFENIFKAPTSKVETIIIAGNSHSKKLAEFGLMADQHASDIFSVTFIEGDFCSGNLIIARRL